MGVIVLSVLRESISCDKAHLILMYLTEICLEHLTNTIYQTFVLYLL